MQTGRRAVGRSAAAVLATGLVATGLAAGCSRAPASRQVAASVAVTDRTAAPRLTSTAPSSSRSTGVPSGPASSTAARTVTVLGSGDVLIHPPLWEQAAADARAEHRSGYDFRAIYAGIRPITRAADLATCELETPLAPPQGPFSGWPNFSAPPQVLDALRDAGYDSCTTASNHTLDQGYPGVQRTLDELDAAGLRHTGSARTAAEAAQPLILTTAGGVRVAQLAYAFGFNGIALPAGQPWLANLTDPATILAAAHRARIAGADVVVLSLHWGTEYQHAPTAEQTALADRLLASPDIDLILGDHTHVVQPFALLHGKWVAYGMGNQISRHADPINDNREGVMPMFTLTETRPHHFVVTRAAAVATWMQLAPQLRLIALRTALAAPATSAADRVTYQAALRRITGYVDSLGAQRSGLTVD